MKAEESGLIRTVNLIIDKTTHRDWKRKLLLTLFRVSLTSRKRHEMASGLICSAIVAVKEKTPLQSSQSQQFQQRLQELLDKIMQGENEVAAFDRFSERVVSYLRSRIDVVTRGLTCIWSDFHQIRLDITGVLHIEWKQLIDDLKGSVDFADDGLLKQSVYNEVYSMLVSEYFNLHTGHNTEPMVTSTY